jgi:tetratricopeptide (TPR) repeat protein
MTPSDPELRRRNASLIVIALLFAACLAIYGQTVGFGFINLDDNLYVYQNSYVASGLNLASLKWAFTTFHSANWHPLTWISHMLDVSLFGMKPGVQHFINVLFHAANSVLVFVVFVRLTGDTWKSAIVAFLFAVHPAHVESVAWISERKDVLSTLFWLLTMLAYVRFARDESASNASLTERYGSSNYVLAILCFALGLMAKPMLVTLPFVLLLIDYWPLKRVQKLGDLPRLILEKAPFLALSVASCIVTLIAQRASGAVESFEGLSIVSRSMNALISYVQYIALLLYPHDLGVWYPPRGVDGKFAVVALIALVVISIICVWQSATRRYLLFGWLWFLGTLVPVIGVVQVGGQSMADRYTYIPSIGIFIMIVWAGAEIMDRLRLNPFLRTAIPAVVILVLMIAAHIQTRYWHDNETLYVRTLNVTGDNFLIAHNLCYVYVFSDRYAEAKPLCERSIELNPNFADAQNTLGILQLKQKQLEDSERTFRSILNRWPGYVPAYPNIAAVLISREQPEEAERFLENAARMTEGSIDRITWTEPVKNLADLYAAQNKMEKAAENYARAIFLEPNRADLRLAAASALYRNAKYDDALRQLQPAIALDPNNADAFYLGGKIYAAKGMQADAVQMLEKAIAIRPDFSEARATLSEISGGQKND